MTRHEKKSYLAIAVQQRLH